MEQCQLIKLALLGNKEAAKRLTEAGALVPCPKCGAPMTDEAEGMMLERWKEALKND